MENIGAVVVFVIVLAIPVASGFVVGKKVGKGDGWREYAAGQVKCELAEQPDKTIEWECKSNQP